MEPCIYVVDRSLINQMRYGNETILQYEIHYPHFTARRSMPGLAAINEQYRRQALYLAQAIPAEYMPSAAVDFEDHAAQGLPFSPYEYVRRFTLTYDQRAGSACLASLYTDAYLYTGGAHGNTVRTAETWDAVTGDLLPLSAFYPDGQVDTARILAAIQAEIAAQEAAQPGIYFENTPALAAQYFNPENYFLTPDALAVFYQQIEIAPYASGIPTFYIPYRQAGMVLS